MPMIRDIAHRSRRTGVGPLGSAARGRKRGGTEMGRRTKATFFGVAVAVAALLAIQGGLGAAEQYPVPYLFSANVIAGATQPGTSPPGSNIWSCRPSAADPRPVVLVHGLFANKTDNWQTM